MLNFLSIIFAIMLSISAFAVSPVNFLSFEDSFKCNDRFPHHSFCNAVEFKEWSEKEKRYITSILKEIDRPELKNFYQAIKDKGIKKLHRVKYSSTWYPNMAQRRTEFSRSARSALIWVNPVTNVVGITDSFFNSKDFIDPYAKVSRKTLNILHEMVHIFDIATDHTSNKISRSIGWTWVQQRNRFEIRDQDYDEVLAKFDQILSYVKAGDSPMAYSEDRRLGIELGFPTIYAMTNSHECFAELLSYYILDPYSREYLSIEVQDKLDLILNTKH
mgnify:FL=1